VSEDTLEQLLHLIANGDRAAFDRLYDQCLSRVYGLALRVVRRPETAEDVVAEVFLQVWRKAKNFDASRSPALAWLLLLTRSRALDQLRRDQAWRGSSFEEIEGEEHPTPDPGPHDLLEVVQRDGHLHQALTALDDESRQLIALAFFRDLSHSELAEATNTPLGTVKSRLRRAMQTLRKHLAANGGPPLEGTVYG